jgi:hypothetical protein
MMMMNSRIMVAWGDDERDEGMKSLDNITEIRASVLVSDDHEEL